MDFTESVYLRVGVDQWKESTMCSPEVTAVSWAVKMYVTLLRHNIYNQKMHRFEVIRDCYKGSFKRILKRTPS